MIALKKITNRHLSFKGEIILLSNLTILEDSPNKNNRPKGIGTLALYP